MLNEINENMAGRQALRPYGDGVAGFKSHRRPPRELALVSPGASVRHKGDKSKGVSKGVTH